MSLEQLRAQAEAEEDKTEVEVQPEAADDPEISTDQEEGEAEDAETTEESDDFELELEGEPEPSQQKYDPVEVLQHKLSRERKKKREAKSEVEDLKAEIEQLKSMMSGNQQAAQPKQSQVQPNQAKFPDLYDKGIDGDRSKYDAAVREYMADMQKVQAQDSQAAKAEQEQRERLESMTAKLAERAAKFASEHKVHVDRVADALDKATTEIDQSTGIDGALAFMLDSVGDGSERVAYYIGTNESAMAQIKSMLRDDPQGFKAISHMTRLADKLKPRHSRKISKAPEPDQPLRGDSSKGSVSAKRVQEMWDKATTPQQMLEARKKARELGVKIET